MSEYVVNFGDKSSAFVGLAMAEAESHGATLKERVMRCRDCYWCRDSLAWAGAYECDYINRGVEPDGFCAWGERREP